MEYFRLDPSGPQVSRVILGGHEYLPDGRSRGFNEDFDRAIRPGVVMDGFGGPERLAVLEAALDLGITCFDVTIDSEKEALGRNLRHLSPSFDVFVQTRPEGMVYGYDPGNRKMADRTLLRDEVIRILKLMGRERIDILNFGILRNAIDADPTFLDRLGENIAALKQSARRRAVRWIQCTCQSLAALRTCRSGLFYTQAPPTEKPVRILIDADWETLHLGRLARRNRYVQERTG